MIEARHIEALKGIAGEKGLLTGPDMAAYETGARYDTGRAAFVAYVLAARENGSADGQAQGFVNPDGMKAGVFFNLGTADKPGHGHPILYVAQMWDWIFPLEDTPNYEPDPSTSIGARARAKGVDPMEEAYDRLLDDDGKAMLLVATSNLEGNSLDTVGELLHRDDVVLGLGDGGAHYGMICDASYSTYFLAHWARDRKSGKAWLAHCYGMIGAGRDTAVDSGPGTELYVVIGHAPRQLDRNIAVVGRVVQGMELLSALPRGTGALGFYEKPEQRVAIRSVRLAADVPAAERTNIEILRTDTRTFADLVESRRNRRDDWYKVPAGKIDLCNVPIPVRAAGAAK